MSQKKTYEQIASEVREFMEATGLSEKQIVDQLAKNERNIYQAGPGGIPEKRTQNRASADSYKDIDDRVFVAYHRLRSGDTREKFIDMVDKTVNQFLTFKTNNSKTYEDYVKTLTYPTQKRLAKMIQPSVDARLGIKVELPVVRPTTARPTTARPTTARPVAATTTSQPKSGYVTVPKSVAPKDKGFYSAFLSMLPGIGSKKEETKEEEPQPLATTAVTTAATTAVSRPVSRPVYQAPTTLVPIQGYCPINNPNNWCYLNSSIQLLNDIPELKAGFATLTPAQIAAVEKTLLSSREMHKMKQGLTVLHSIFAVLAASDFKTAIDFKSKTVPNGTSIYKEYIDFLLSDEEKKFAVHRRPFHTDNSHYVKQSDADEAVIRSLDALFSANLDFLLKLKYMFTFQEVSVFNCENTAIGNQGYIETITGSPLSTSMELALHKLDDYGNPTAWVKSLQEAIDNTEELETLTADNNMLENCGVNGKKGKALTKGIKFIIFPFTKYLFIKIKRLEEGVYYKEKIDVNKTLTVDGVEFQPRGVIHHSGSLSAGGTTTGHYTYYHFENGVPTILCNDASISRITNPATAWTSINTGGRAVLYERKTPIEEAKVDAAVQVEKDTYTPSKKLFQLINQKRINAKRLRDINAEKVHKNVSKLQSIELVQGIQATTTNDKVRNYTRKQLNYLQKDKARINMMANLEKTLKEGIHKIRTQAQAQAQAQPQGAVQENNEDGEFEAFMVGEEPAATTAVTTTTATTSSNENSNADSTIALEPMNGGRKRKTRKNKNKKN